MKIFIDSADIQDIRNAADTGFLDGITTNPSLVRKVARPYKAIVQELIEEFNVPVSMEVLTETTEEMVAEAREYASLSSLINVKIPLTSDGLKAVRILTSEKIQTNVTLCFSAVQALLAAKAGATYISPFIGRLDDAGHYGMELVQEIRQIYDTYGFPTEIIAASIRHPLHVKDAALSGADIATIPPEIIPKLLAHPLTDAGIIRFRNDAATIPAKEK